MKEAIYLAGGMKSKWQDKIIEASGNSWFEVIDPRSHGLKDEKEYTAWDLDGIARSVTVVAYMDSDNPSGYGLSLEVGYAIGLGIPVWYVCEDTTDRQRFFGMVRSVAHRNFNSLADCIEALKAS